MPKPITLQAVAHQVCSWQDHWAWAAGIPGAGVAVAHLLLGRTANDAVLWAAGFVALDIATGLLKGAVGQRLSSRVAAAGLPKKLGMFYAIVLGHLVDGYLGTHDLFKGGFAHYVCGIETLSILENLSRVGLALPPPLLAPLRLLMDHSTDESAKEAEAQATPSGG